MKRIAIVGKTPLKISELKKELEKYHFVYAEKDPEVVISYGGDGTFLIAEREYPGIPKVLLRDSKICKKCHENVMEHELDYLAHHALQCTEHLKLEAKFQKKSLLCANDFVLRNVYPTHAIRFEISLDGTKVDAEYIGDGVVIATPFGAGAYFYSITKETFTEGTGIAFNNVTIAERARIVPANTEILLLLTRGHAVFVADNNPEIVHLKSGDSVTINKSSSVARIVDFSRK